MVSKHTMRRILVALAASLVLPPLAHAQELGDAETREVAAYRLTADALEKYAAATRALAPVLAENQHGCDEGGDESLSGLAARLDAVPGASAALSEAGMSSREYFVFSFAMVQAGMGAWSLSEGGGELPAGFSKENVAFYQAHEAEFQELSGILPETDCGDEDYGGEEEGSWEEAEDWEHGDEGESDG